MQQVCPVSLPIWNINSIEQLWIRTPKENTKTKSYPTTNLAVKGPIWRCHHPTPPTPPKSCRQVFLSLLWAHTPNTLLKSEKGCFKEKPQYKIEWLIVLELDMQIVNKFSERATWHEDAKSSTLKQNLTYMWPGCQKTRHDKNYNLSLWLSERIFCKNRQH